jgi:hypothetical protein
MPIYRQVPSRPQGARTRQTATISECRYRLLQVQDLTSRAYKIGKPLDFEEFSPFPWVRHRESKHLTLRPLFSTLGNISTKEEDRALMKVKQTSPATRHAAAYGPSRHLACAQQSSRFQVNANINGRQDRLAQ